jgi:hypothetical protein
MFGMFSLKILQMIPDSCQDSTYKQLAILATIMNTPHVIEWVNPPQMHRYSSLCLNDY